MKLLVLYSTFLCSVLFMFSCNKKETKKEEAVQTTTGNSNTSATIPSGLSNSTNYETCSLSSVIYYYNTLGVVTKDSAVNATFKSTLPGSGVTPTNVFAGSVTFNGMSLTTTTISGLQNFYGGSFGWPVNFTSNNTWSVSGSGTVTPFSISFVPSYPIYTGASSLPDTCSKSAGISLNINGISNSQGYYTVSLVSGAQLILKVSTTTTSLLNIASSELSNFPVNQNIYINVSVANLFGADLNGLRRGFSNGIIYRKTVYLKP